MKPKSLLSFILIGILFVACSNDSGTNSDDGSNGDNGVSITVVLIEGYTKDSMKTAFCRVLVTDNEINPISDRGVSWAIISGRGTLENHTTITREPGSKELDGTTDNYIRNITSNELQLKATVLGSSASVIIHFTEFPEI